MPDVLGIQSGSAHCRDVSKNALKELPECVCNMSNLISLYARLRTWRRVRPRRAERWCRRKAEHNELQALPDLASSQTLLNVCVRCRSGAIGAAAEGRLWFTAGS
jgi:hypothetical protein